MLSISNYGYDGKGLSLEIYLKDRSAEVRLLDKGPGLIFLEPQRDGHGIKTIPNIKADATHGATTCVVSADPSRCLK